MLWTVRHCWLAGARFAINFYRHWAQLLLLQPGEPPVTILRLGGVESSEDDSTSKGGVGGVESWQDDSTPNTNGGGVESSWDDSTPREVGGPEGLKTLGAPTAS